MMRPGSRPPRIRRADPRLGAGREGPEEPETDGSSVLIRVLFSVVLVVPRLRALRRTRHWIWVRAVLLLSALAAAVQPVGWWRALALVPAALAILLRRTVDPDSERRVQRVLGAEYFLNGGEWAGDAGADGADRLAVGTPLYLMLRGPHLLLVPRGADGEVHSALRVDGIERILVDGEDYVPVYVSEAKQPPVRERDVDRHACAELVLAQRGGRHRRFRYRGPFARHLAETAAHAVYSVRSQEALSLPGAGRL